VLTLIVIPAVYALWRGRDLTYAPAAPEWSDVPSYSGDAGRATESAATLRSE
jgi:hypothetical protein